jgi:hypothetical protein
MGGVGDLMDQVGNRELSPVSHSTSLSVSDGGQSKKSEKFRVYNESREGFLSAEVAVFDTTAEPLKRLFDYLVNASEAGLWLKPYRGIPASQGARYFDLVYLDDENRVAEDLDNYPNPQFNVLKDEPASALLLPAHTVFASQIRRGDQLGIRSATELEGMLETLANALGGESEDRSNGHAEVRHSNGSSHFAMTPDAYRAPQQPPQQTTANAVEGEGESTESLSVRAWRWLFPKSKSGYRSNRVPLPGLIAYHWSGGTPQAYQLGNLSKTGFYLLTDERPYPGTLILMTLQRTGKEGEKLGSSIAVFTKVIRWGSDGVGFAFVTLELREAKESSGRSNRGADQEALQEFLRRFDLP